MKTSNGKNKRNSDNQEGRLGISQIKSRKLGDEQDKIVDFDSKRSNQNEQSSFGRRRKIIGGMLSQLMQDSEAQLAHSEHQVSYHQKQVAHLQNKIEHYKALKSLLLEEDNEIKQNISSEEE